MSEKKWVSLTLSDICTALLTGGTPDTGIAKYWSGSIPWITGADFLKQKIAEPRRYITEEAVRCSNTNVIKAGNLLVVTRTGVGKVAIAPFDIAVSQDTTGIYFQKNICVDFIFYYVQSRIGDLKKLNQGTSINGLLKEDLLALELTIPEVYLEQQKIANILKTIDRTITHTEALIEKYQQIKVGLMHDLFTRGIGADGQLRSTREQAPELYWESPIGWIPKEWIFATCLDVCEKVIDCKNRTPPIMPDGYPVIRTPNVRNGLFIDDELVFTDYYSYSIWTARGKPEPEDIVITREAPVGEVCKIPKRHQSACLGQRMMLYRTDPAKIINDYFLYVLQSKAVQNRLDLISGGSTVGHVRVGDIRGLWIFYPESKSEQLKIAEALNRISGKIENEINQLNKLKMQKSGLMHDLLTGKVQVTIGKAT
jgi:type I restriction enzyme, S subunit